MPHFEASILEEKNNWFSPICHYFLFSLFYNFPILSHFAPNIKRPWNSVSPSHSIFFFPSGTYENIFCNLWVIISIKMLCLNEELPVSSLLTSVIMPFILSNTRTIFFLIQTTQDSLNNYSIRKILRESHIKWKRKSQIQGHDPFHSVISFETLWACSKFF